MGVDRGGMITYHSRGLIIMWVVGRKFEWRKGRNGVATGCAVSDL